MRETGMIKIWQTKFNNVNNKNCTRNITILETLEEGMTHKKFTCHPSYNHRFHEIFKECNITLAIQNKFNSKMLIKANYKEK